MVIANCQFSSDELAVFQKFWQVCEDISTCRFIRDLPKQKQKFTIERQPDGTCRSTYPNYDKDDFLAYLTHFRKLVAEGETTNIFRILKLIAKYATDSERITLKGIRKNLVAEATAPAIQIAIGTPGNETSYTPKQIENILFNAQVFHTDDSLQGDLRKILDFAPLTKMAFLAYATLVSRQAWEISRVLKNKGYV